MNCELRQFLKKYWIAAKRNNWNFRRVSEEHAKNSPRLAHKSKIPLKLLGLSIEERHAIFFHFVPMYQHAGIFEKFHIKVGKGMTSSFTKKAIKRRVTIQKGVVLGYLYTLARFNE